MSGQADFVPWKRKEKKKGRKEKSLLKAMQVVNWVSCYFYGLLCISKLYISEKVA